MKVVKKIGEVLIAFLLTLLIVLNFVIILVSNTILNKNYLISRLEKSDFYEKIETDLKNGFEEYQYQSGLPESVFDNLCSTEMIKEDINLVINNLYDGTEISSSNLEIVKQKITENVNDYLRENNVVLTGEQQKNIDEFQQLIIDVYANKTVNLFSSFSTQIGEMIQKVSKVIGVVKIFVEICLIIFIVILIICNFRNIGSLLNIFGIALSSSGMLLIWINWLINKNINIDNILLISESLSYLIKDIIYNILSNINIYGLSFAVIGFISIIIGNYKKNNSGLFRNYKD